MKMFFHGFNMRYCSESSGVQRVSTDPRGSAGPPRVSKPPIRSRCSELSWYTYEVCNQFSSFEMSETPVKTQFPDWGPYQEPAYGPPCLTTVPKNPSYVYATVLSKTRKQVRNKWTWLLAMQFIARNHLHHESLYSTT